MNEPRSTNVFGLWSLPSWTPRPMDLPPCSRATIGLMMSLVNAAISMLNASATTSPTAMTITSPRSRKFLKPLIGPLSDSRMVSCPVPVAPPVIVRPAVIETRSPVLCRTIHARVL